MSSRHNAGLAAPTTSADAAGGSRAAASARSCRCAATSVAVVLVSSFWILSNWPAVVRAAVATHSSQKGLRSANFGRRHRIFSLTTIPAFAIVEVLLPPASGFQMFALIANNGRCDSRFSLRSLISPDSGSTRQSNCGGRRLTHYSNVSPVPARCKEAQRPRDTILQRLTCPVTEIGPDSRPRSMPSEY